jgi:hypothetical protein
VKSSVDGPGKVLDPIAEQPLLKRTVVIGCDALLAANDHPEQQQSPYRHRQRESLVNCSPIARKDSPWKERYGEFFLIRSRRV